MYILWHRPDWISWSFWQNTVGVTLCNKCAWLYHLDLAYEIIWNLWQLSWWLIVVAMSLNSWRLRCDQACCKLYWITVLIWPFCVGNMHFGVSCPLSCQISFGRGWGLRWSPFTCIRVCLRSFPTLIHEDGIDDVICHIQCWESRTIDWYAWTFRNSSDVCVQHTCAGTKLSCFTDSSTRAWLGR